MCVCLSGVRIVLYGFFFLLCFAPRPFPPRIRFLRFHFLFSLLLFMGEWSGVFFLRPEAEAEKRARLKRNPSPRKRRKRQRKGEQERYTLCYVNTNPCASSLKRKKEPQLACERITRTAVVFFFPAHGHVFGAHVMVGNVCRLLWVLLLDSVFGWCADGGEGGAGRAEKRCVFDHRPPGEKRNGP